MAILYSSFISEVAPFVLGCPDTLIVNHVRRSVIDVCVRASVYRRDLEVISTQAGVYEYALGMPMSSSSGHEAGDTVTDLSRLRLLCVV